ncbi:hypothetical protein [uncultured Flavonifractor sp.]|uniref:hypothetical protein n=1 Tax=uncultured Flavonifractor sp. TaxID=1193534 RepID=UPI0026246F72|nr:hypothetical protein [uncultured Flavonifractor sp.]
MFDHEFDWEEDEETALLEETTGFALLEAEDEDNSEALRVLERQVSTLEVQLENLQDSLEELEQPESAEALRRRERIEGEIEGLTARILELETQIDMLNGI